MLYAARSIIFLAHCRLSSITQLYARLSTISLHIFYIHINILRYKNHLQSSNEENSQNKRAKLDSKTTSAAATR